MKARSGSASRARPSMAGTTSSCLSICSSSSIILLLILFSSLHPTDARRPPSSLDLSYKRLIQEFKDVVASGMALTHPASGSSGSNNSTEYIRLAPCRANLHEWHFTIAGPPGSVYEGGLYHGRVLLPGDYPASAPRLQMLNPSGRFEVGADICLSATAFHQETWQPVWTVRTLVSALRSHMATKAVEIGGIEASARRRQVLAQRSRSFTCKHCATNHALFPGSIFRGLPEVDVPIERRRVTKSTRVVVRSGEVGETDENRQDRGGRMTRKQRAPHSSSLSFLYSVYRNRYPLTMCILFFIAFLILNVGSPQSVI